MSLLDVKEIIPGQTVIQHQEDIPGFIESKRLAYGNERKFQGPSRFLYEQRRGTRYSEHSSFLDMGYNRLPPVCDLRVALDRQKVIKEFIADQPGGKRYHSILNLMHLINEWTFIDRRFEGGIPSLAVSAKFLRRYIDEAEKFISLLRSQGGFLDKLADSMDCQMQREELGLLEKACTRGEYDSLIITRTQGGDLNFVGVIGDNRPKGVPYKSLGKFSLYELTGGWTQEELVWTGFKKGMHMLNEIFSPFAALYFEAAYMRRRQLEGKLVCLPELNSEGKFEIKEGEPILSTPNPVPRSFSFDRVNARSILNGLHSAGKTHLLLDIPLYIIRAHRGFPNPAKRNNVPLTKRIFHSVDIEKRNGGGSLHSELLERASEIRHAREGDLYLIDEFLQHASPDAAEPLEPIILDAYAHTRGTFIIVDHRGESIEDGKDWNFWSPEYSQSPKGDIEPTFKFARGKPSTDILIRHGRQLIRKVIKEIDQPAQETVQYDESVRGINYRDQSESTQDYARRIEKRVLGGQY